VIEQQGGIRVSDDTMNRLGSLLEQLGARFDLVLEAVTGFGGRLDKLQSEMVGQFAEVGRQVRFISDRIAENREANAATRSDLGAEMIRLGEMLGATRVELRDQLGLRTMDEMSGRSELLSAEPLYDNAKANKLDLSALLHLATPAAAPTREDRVVRRHVRSRQRA